MVVVETMDKPTLKVSMSDSDSSSLDESEESENEIEVQTEELQEPEADVESESSEDGDESDSAVLLANEGWADAVVKVLGSTKPKNKKTLVLSRAKKHSEIVKKEKEEKPEYEVIGDNKSDVKPAVKKEDPSSVEPPVKKKKQEKEKSKIRLKPNILDKDRERLLNKIATKGVVQLFNAVRNQQKTLEKEMREDLTETKKEKILKKFDKRTFLDSLMGNTKSIIVDEAKQVKNEVKAEEAPKWSALRDDFMMGAKMKDWDKESVDE